MPPIPNPVYKPHHLYERREAAAALYYQKSVLATITRSPPDPAATLLRAEVYCPPCA